MNLPLNTFLGKAWETLTKFWRSWLAVLAPLILLAVPLTANEEDVKAMWCAYTILVCAVYWIAECVPLAITSLFPVIILPLAGVLSTDAVCRNYLKGTNMMFLAGLIMAVAVEHCGLHERIALNMIQAVGTSQRRLMLGFMLCAMFLSMWISNTAACAMMVPIVDSLHKAIHQSKDIELSATKSDTDDKVSQDSSSKNSKSRNILLLACAYASNIGGTGVITGSPPNLTVLASLNKKYSPDQNPLSYATWMLFCIPLMLLNTLLAWAVLCLIESLITRGEEKPTEEDERNAAKVLEKKRRELGKMSMHEFQVLVLFILLVILWFFQRPYFMPGWAELFTEVAVASATPAVFIVSFLFLLPRTYSLRQSSPALLGFRIVEQKLPWNVILLLGGGFALADATSKSGLSTFLSGKLETLGDLGYWQINLLIATIVTFTTEVASNTATANIVVPILMEISVRLCINPLYMMLTSAICCSYAFMLPVATAPNAIVFAHSTLKTSDMMKTGLLLNIICIITTNFAINTWGAAIFGLTEFPDWAADPAVSNCTDTAVTMRSILVDAMSNETLTVDLPSPIATGTG